MSEMVERVARAIAEGWEGGWDDPDHRERFKADARAAVAAMREPTEAMLVYALNQAGQTGKLEMLPGAAWRAMIDAALSDA